jgi:hypothetical protein
VEKAKNGLGWLAHFWLGLSPLIVPKILAQPAQSLFHNTSIKVFMRILIKKL